MTKLLGPYALSAGGQAPFDVEWDNVSQPPLGVEIENISGLLLQVLVGGTQSWLAPWTARYYKVAAAATKVSVTSTGDLSPSAADPLRLIATLYQQGDTEPTETQRGLSSLALLAGISGQVSLANGTVVGLSGGTAVGITGVPSVNVSNTPGVNIANTPGVNVNNTPGVTVGNTVGVQNTTLTALFQNPTVTLVASGTVQALSGFISITASSGIPATTRSMLLLLQPQAPVATGTVSITSLSGTGLQSQENWLSANNLNISLIANAAVSPIYFPFYAAIDSSISISVGTNNSGDHTTVYKYWLMALPDADIVGSSNTPEAVYLADRYGNTPITVPVKDTPGATLSSGQITMTSSAVATLIPAQNSPFIVDFFTIDSAGATQINLQTNTQFLGLFPNTATGYHPGWVIPAGQQVLGSTTVAGTSARCIMTGHII